jgi:hypothetical protein
MSGVGERHEIGPRDLLDQTALGLGLVLQAQRMTAAKGGHDVRASL